MPEIQMPKLSDTMTEGTLVAWKKKKGDKVSAGDVLAEIETDKATMEWESPEDGTLSEIYVEEGGKVEVGQPIAFIGEPGETRGREPDSTKKPDRQKAEGEPKGETEKPAPAKQKQKETAPPQEEQKPGERTEREKKPIEQGHPTAGRDRDEGVAASDQARVKASPVARRIAGQLGVDLTTIRGTGPEGRIIESDVRAAAKGKSAAPATPRAGRDRDDGVGAAGEGVAAPTQAPPARRGAQQGETRVQLSGMRRGIAERLTQSKGPVPHFYLNIDIDAGPLIEARAELKAAGEESEAAKITVNDFVLKASVMAALKVPKVNAIFDGDSILQFADIDLGLAVAIEDGLLTPVIRAAQNKSLREISAQAKDLATRARNKRMKPEEFKGGAFTVSNLGGMDIDSFTAIINPPQSFILAIGKIEKVPVVDNCDQISVGHRMSIWMSCDHRVIDGALGAQYLKELRQLLENPALLLV